MEKCILHDKCIIVHLNRWGWEEKEMSINLIFVSVLFSIIVITLILVFIRNGRINIKYSLIWLLLFLLFLIFLMVPGLLSFITHVLGFQTASNMILSILIAVLVVINICLTGIVSSQDKKIRLLVQEVSIMKKDLNKNGN